MPTKIPIAFRGNVPLKPLTETRMRNKLVRRIGHASSLLRRGTVRFEDINGPRGGVDKVCRIKLVLTGRPSVQVDDRAPAVEPAFDGASHKAQRALERVQRRSRPERKPMKLQTARRAPARKAVKTKARTAKHRVGTQRSRR